MDHSVPHFASLAVELTDTDGNGTTKTVHQRRCPQQNDSHLLEAWSCRDECSGPEYPTGVRKSGLYAEFKDKKRTYLSRACANILTCWRHAGTLTKQPSGWKNVESFLKVCYGSWGQKGCFSVNSMREFADLPPTARKIMIANMTKAHQLLIDNLAAARGGTDNNESLADLIITFFCGICLEQNLGPGPHSNYEED